MGPDADDREPNWLHLGADERVVWERRPHVVAMGRGLPIGVGLVCLGVAVLVWNAAGGPSDWLSLIGLAVAGAGAVLVGIRYLHWTNTRYVITSEELYEKRGFVSREITQFRLERVQTTSLDQSVVGRVLGYGDLTIYTAGSGDPELTFRYVPRPEEAGRVLNDELVDVAPERPAGA